MRPRFLQLFASCVVLGIGVGLLLRAALGSDGWSTMINGITLAMDVPFVLVNCAVGVIFIALAWSRGLKPGWGTVIQPVVVGGTVTGVLAILGEQHAIVVRLALLVAALPIVVVGVAGYLGSGAGAGPTEAAPLALDPPLPFKWTYSFLQGGGALLGWGLGASLGAGTIIVIFLLGPAVDLVSRRARFLDIHAAAR